MNGADLIAHILRKEGIEHLPAFPHADIIDSAAKVGIRPLIVRQERQALHMADGYARVNGGRRICATTVQHGPGSENAFGAVAQCFAENVPVLHIPGGYSRCRARGVAQLHGGASHAGDHQVVRVRVPGGPHSPDDAERVSRNCETDAPGPVGPRSAGTTSSARRWTPALLDAYRVDAALRPGGQRRRRVRAGGQAARARALR